MQKKYVFIIFYFLSNNAKAQLSQDLAKFTKTLKNVAAKLTEVLPFAPFIFDRPAGKLLKGVPVSGGRVEVNDKRITIPPNSTVAVAGDNNPIITISAGGGNVKFPSAFYGYLGVTVNSDVLLPGKTVPFHVPAGKYIVVEEEGIVKITPKPSGVSPSEKVMIVPASGIATVFDKVVEAPPGSIIKLIDLGIGIMVKVAAKGGKVRIPAAISAGGIIEVSVDSTVEIPGQPAQNLSAGDSIDVFDDKIVTITPKGIVVPVEQLPANFIISGGIHVKVPPNGRIETSDDYFMKVPLDSKVTKYPDEVFDIGLPSGGLVKLANNETITAPAGSTIRSTKYGPIVFLPSRGGDIIIPPDTSIITLVDSIAKDSEGTKEIPALKEKTPRYGGLIKINPIIPFGGVEVKVPAAGGDIKLSTGEVINVPKGSSVKKFPDEVDTILITLSSDGSVTLPNKKVIKAPAGSKIKFTKEESVVIIAISGSGVSATLPANTKFYVSSPAMVRAANMPDTKATPGEHLSAPIDVTITLTPL